MILHSYLKIRPVTQQRLDSLLISRITRSVQTCVPIYVRRVDLCPILTEQSDDRHKVVVGGVVERVVVGVVGDVWVTSAVYCREQRNAGKKKERKRERERERKE